MSGSAFSAGLLLVVLNGVCSFAWRFVLPILGFLGTNPAKMPQMGHLWCFSLLLVVIVDSIAAVLAPIASDLGGSPVVGPAQFKVGIVLSFLVYSFLFGGLGAI